MTICLEGQGGAPGAYWLFLHMLQSEKEDHPAHHYHSLVIQLAGKSHEHWQ